jgi:hypothetical protein
MPVITSFVERRIVLRLNLGPGPMLDILGLLGFKAVSTAVRLDLFEALGNRPLTVTELAQRIRA